MPRHTLDSWVRKLKTMTVLLTKNTEEDIYNHMVKMYEKAEELFEKYEMKYDNIMKEFDNEENHMYAKYNWRQGDPSRFWLNNAERWYLVDVNEDEKETVLRDFFLVTYDIWADFMICDKYANHWNEEKSEWKDMFKDVERIRNILTSHCDLIKCYEAMDFIKFKSRWQQEDKEWIRDNELLKEHKQNHPKIELPSTTNIDLIPDEYPSVPLRDDCKYCKKHWEDTKSRYETVVKIWEKNRQEYMEWKRQEAWEKQKYEEDRKMKQEIYNEWIKKKESLDLHCKHCDFQAEDELDLEEHNKTEEHKKKSRYCNICQLQCRNDADYKYHVETIKHKKNAGLIEKVKVYKCSHCDYQTTIKCNFEKHIVNKNHQ